MANKLRLGKAYEHTILGMLTLEHFDVYQPVVDDQGIDGVIRVRGKGAEPARYYELQVKGSKTWSGIRCKVQRMTKRGVLILYCAAERELLWFLYEELPKYFPAKNPDWGDIFLNRDSVSTFKSQGRDKLDELLKWLQTQANYSQVPRLFCDMSNDLLRYRFDPDLEFLQRCDQPDVDILVIYLTKTKKGNDRVTETLTLEPRYKEFQPNHAKYWDLIAAELQHFGANTLATFFRGQGVLYRTILIEVCSRLKVNFNKKSPVEIIEMNLLMKILIDSLDKMDPEELKKVVKGLNLKTTNFTKEAVIAALQAAMRMGGFATYQIAVIVANSVAKALLNRGLSLGANAALSRLIGVFAGPIGWVLTGVWTLMDIAGPAFRVTIPAVIQVAYMRIKSKGTQLGDAAGDYPARDPPEADFAISIAFDARCRQPQLILFSLRGVNQYDD